MAFRAVRQWQRLGLSQAFQLAPAGLGAFAPTAALRVSHGSIFLPPPHSFQGLRECLPVGGPPRPPDPSDLPLLSGACFPSGALLFLLVWTSEFRSSDLFVVCLPDSTVLWRVSGAEWLGGAADGLASVTAVCAGLSVRKGRRLPRGAGISCVNAPGR